MLQEASTSIKECRQPNREITVNYIMKKINSKTNFDHTYVNYLHELM